MKIRLNGLFQMLGVGALSLGLVGVLAPFASADQMRGRDVGNTPDTAKVGEKAPNFELRDMDGEVHTLNEYIADGKTVVLEWFNPGCPYVVRHHETHTTMKDIARDFKDKDVVWLAINSTNTSHPDFAKAPPMIKKWKVEYPVLDDSSGKVGKMYGARTTPHMYVINSDGILAYAGAIDNDRRGNKSESDRVNYVRQALEEIAAGETVTESETTPYGCGIKYAR